MHTYIHHTHLLSNSKLVAFGNLQIFEDTRERVLLQPHYNYMRKVSLPLGNTQSPADGICTHYLKKGAVLLIVRSCV